MAWSPEISQLSTDLDQLTDAVNAKKNLLNIAVTSTQNSKISTNTSAGISANSAILSAASTQIANTHKNSTLSIYGAQSVQQSSLNIASGRTAAAASSVITASAGLTQDLSAVTAQTLHRSPNAIASIFVYDTSKDSDGGAWTEKCQHTSWYNEPIMGKWLGSEVNEIYARYIGATVGPELIGDPDLNNPTYWVVGPYNPGNFTITNGQAIRINDGNAAGIPAPVSLTAGKTYRVRVQLTNTRPTITNASSFNYGSFSVNSGLAGQPANVTSLSKSGNPGESIDLYITPTINTNMITIYNNTNSYANVESISCREVTAITTASNDYFQLTTDGKFYRLWKNLLGSSADLSIAPWGLPNATITGAPGLQTIIVNNGTTSIRSGASQTGTILTLNIPGLTYTFSAEVANTGTRYAVLTLDNSGGLMSTAWFDLQNGTVGAAGGHPSPVTNLTAAITAGSAPGRYIISMTFQWLSSSTALRIMGSTTEPVPLAYTYTITADGTTGLPVANTQLEIGSRSSFETKTVTNTSNLEVFRGNKRDFPRIAGIVAEGTNVNIYDLTEPGRPMWMRFIATATATIAAKNMLVGASANAVVAQNAKLVVGGAVTNLTGLNVVDFARDSAELRLISSYSWLGNIAGRNTTGGYGAVDATIPGIVSGFVGTVAITVLPDAPVDPVTGLRVPTIWAAQSGGVSRIGHNGLVTNSLNAGWANQGSRLEIIGNDIVQVAGDNASYNWNYAWPTTALMNTNARAWAPSTVFGRFNVWNAGWALCERGYALSGPRGTGLLALVETNAAAPVKGLEAIIGSTYNTGWLAGDTRRAYLSDINVGTVTGPDLVVNGTFNIDTAGWGVTAGAAIAAVSGEAELTGNGVHFPRISRSITTVIGRSYRITLSYRKGSYTGTVYLATGGDTQATAASGVITKVIIATSTSTIIDVGMFAGAGTSNGTLYFDNISVREVDGDRSYKAQGASINGTLTRSQVSSGSSLVGYSGWSAANYLQEPYSTELDFGTGEWSASAWTNIPTSNFPTVGPELVTNGGFDTDTAWTKDAGATISGGVATLSSAGIVGISQVIPLKKGYTYLCSVTISNYINGSLYFRFTNATTLDQNILTGNGTKTFYLQVPSDAVYPIWSLSIFGVPLNMSIDNVSVVEVATAPIFQRAFSSGSKLMLGIGAKGTLFAEASDGTTTRTVATSAVYNTAQWLKAEVYYNTDGSLGILVNGREVAVSRGTPLLSLNSRRNLLTWSENLTNNVWVKSNVMIGTTLSIAPDGTTTAQLLYPTSSGNNRWTYQAYSGASAIYTGSIYAKAAGKNFICVDISGGGASAYFNVSTGQVGTVSAGYAASIEPVGNGWYRCSIRNTSSQATSFAGVYAITDADNNSRVVTSNGTDGVLFWGAQIEVSSTATVYQRVTAVVETNIAPLTIGNNFELNTPFPGSIALLKLGATVPTPEQSIFMYEQEKQLFRPGALSVLPDANAIVDMSYDDATDRWAAVSTTNESYWNGLVRSSVTPVPIGSYSKIATAAGIELTARTSTNPGVDVSIPPYALREEFVKKSETASRLVRKTVIYDYTGGFTGNITTGSTSILSIAGIAYPTSYIGARISGTGIPANTTITGVSGTTIYISAPATATTNTLTITFLDFILPIGMEAKVVLSAGVIKREGSTFDYTRLFDGFIETIRFAVAPGSTAWVQIQATRTTQ